MKASSDKPARDIKVSSKAKASKTEPKRPHIVIVDTPEHEQVEINTAKALWRRWQFFMVVSVVVIGGLAIALTRVAPREVAQILPKVLKPTPSPTPVTKLSPLTGVAVDPVLADRPVVAVVIENHTDARPQAGLSQAGVVYEALAEGGITRFLALFLDTQPKTLGPVRSLRTYFIDWALEYGAPVAHAGGNMDALDLIRPLGLTSLNEFSYGSSYYRSNARYAPHNLYTSSDRLDRLMANQGISGPTKFAPRTRKPDSAEATPSHPNLSINFSYNGYQVAYTYDTTHNDYVRSLAGAPHIDQNTGEVIRVKNIVVETMPTSYGTTRIGEQTVIMGTVGTGKVAVLRDGGVVEGTWSKASHAAPTKLLDANGAEIPLNAGNTWFEIVPPTAGVSY